MYQRKAVALISGGLDSMLAARAMQGQGIHVEGINFYTGFCVEGHTQAIRSSAKKPKRNNALWVAEQLGIKLHIIDIIEEYKDVVLNPRHGYGAHMNPCLDCKIFMVQKAYAWMQAHDFDFIITGEVVGQRPMSQRRAAMSKVTADDRLLRPLCAKWMTPTLPEREGWVDRSALFDFNGRSRKPQMALAKKYGYSDYAQPAGGCCMLTNAHYTQKLKDLWAHRGTRDYDLDDIVLLKIGRHLRPVPHYKLIISRDEGEGRYLSGYRDRFIFLEPVSHMGSVAIIDGVPTSSDLPLAAGMVARFGQGQKVDKVEIRVHWPEGKTQEVSVSPMLDINDAWYVEQ